MLLVVTLLSLLTLCMWGLSDYLVSHSGKRINHYVTNFVIQAIGFVAVVPFVLYNGLSLSSAWDAVLMGIAAIFFTVAFMYFIRALVRGPVGVAAPIANSYSVVTLVVSLLLFGVVLSGQMIFALVLIILGALLLSSDRNIFKGKVLHSKTVKLAAVPFIGWGLAFALLNPVVGRNEWYEVLFVTYLGTALLAGILMANAAPRDRSQIMTFLALKNKAAIMAGITAAVGTLAFFFAAGLQGSVIIPAVIASASPLVTSLAAYVVEKEKLLLLNRIGAVLVVFGIAILNL